MEYKGVGLPSIKHVLNRIEYYAEDITKVYEIPKWFLYFDFAKSLFISGAAVMDYFLYDYYLQNHAGKNRFMTLRQKLAFDSNNNSEEGVCLLNDKELTLMKLHQYIQRDWCGIKYHNTVEEYNAFAEKHEFCVVKPLRGVGGRGIEIISTHPENTTLFQYCYDKNVIIEEIIKQHERLNSLYPHAVNSVRIVTLKGKCIAAALRIGTGRNVVDNAHSGGIFSIIDLQTGIIKTVGMTHSKNRFVKHPDTHTIIPGFTIPFWEDCIRLVESASSLIRDVSLIGWDLAITAEGPIIIEANDHPGLEVVQTREIGGLKKTILSK